MVIVVSGGCRFELLELFLLPVMVVVVVMGGVMLIKLHISTQPGLSYKYFNATRMHICVHDHHFITFCINYIWLPILLVVS